MASSTSNIEAGTLFSVSGLNVVITGGGSGKSTISLLASLVFVLYWEVGQLLDFIM